MICLEVVYPGDGAGGRTVIVPGGLFTDGVYNGAGQIKKPRRSGALKVGKGYISQTRAR